jgi:hypothetical protein
MGIGKFIENASRKSKEKRQIWRSKRRCRVGRDNVGGITTRYGLDGPGIESWWQRNFPHTFRPALGPAQPPVQCIQDLFAGHKAGGM